MNYETVEIGKDVLIFIKRFHFFTGMIIGSLLTMIILRLYERLN